VSWLPEVFTPGKLILAEPSNDTPPISLAVSNVVAVSALPVTSPVILPVNVPAIAPVPVIVGLVNVLFVSVSVVSFNTIVPEAFGKLIVLSAVGSVTVSVVSYASAVEPSNVKEPCKNKLPPSVNVAYLPELTPSTILPSYLPLKTKSPNAVPAINASLFVANPLNPLVASLLPDTSLENLIAGPPPLK